MQRIGGMNANTANTYSFNNTPGAWCDVGLLPEGSLVKCGGKLYRVDAARFEKANVTEVSTGRQDVLFDTHDCVLVRAGVAR